MTFSGGIGENSPEIRAAVCVGLGTFGLELDAGRNAAAEGEATISTDSSPARILVIPADEERIVARATAEVVAGQQA